MDGRVRQTQVRMNAVPTAARIDARINTPAIFTLIAATTIKAIKTHDHHFVAPCRNMLVRILRRTAPRTSITSCSSGGHSCFPKSRSRDRVACADIGSEANEDIDAWFLKLCAGLREE